MNLPRRYRAQSHKFLKPRANSMCRISHRSLLLILLGCFQGLGCSLHHNTSCTEEGDCTPRYGTEVTYPEEALSPPEEPGTIHPGTEPEADIPPLPEPWDHKTESQPYWNHTPLEKAPSEFVPPAHLPYDPTGKSPDPYDDEPVISPKVPVPSEIPQYQPGETAPLELPTETAPSELPTETAPQEKPDDVAPGKPEDMAPGKPDETTPAKPEKTAPEPKPGKLPIPAAPEPVTTGSLGRGVAAEFQSPGTVSGIAGRRGGPAGYRGK